MKTFEDWLEGKMLGSMEKEFAKDAWFASRNAALEEAVDAIADLYNSTGTRNINDFCTELRALKGTEK